MSIADRLLVGSVLALAGFVVVAGGRAPSAGARGAPTAERRRAPTAADTLRARREHGTLFRGVPEGAEVPAWLQEVHVGRLVETPPAEPARGASAAEVQRAAE
jgi:hypothetical protein